MGEITDSSRYRIFVLISLLVITPSVLPATFIGVGGIFLITCLAVPALAMPGISTNKEPDVNDGETRDFSI